MITSSSFVIVERFFTKTLLEGNSSFVALLEDSSENSLALNEFAISIILA